MKRSLESFIPWTGSTPFRPVMRKCPVMETETTAHTHPNSWMFATVAISDQAIYKHSHVAMLAANTKLRCEPARFSSARPRDRHPVIEESLEKLESFQATWIHLRFPLVWNSTMGAATTSRQLELLLQR